MNTQRMRQVAAGVGAGCLLAGGAAVLAPSASAAPDCSPAAVKSTVDNATNSAQGYLASHPGAGAVVSAAMSQPRPEAATNVRNYFTAHPNEYYELRNILAPIGETQQQCNTTVLSGPLASAYDEFMAG
ncbi:heme-binding protein [Mycolicibacillus parakoreensis]|uniref:Heme-binding protein n=1 Tax=Mycolicibacillus parakoreensis TaxID=1069221 RepID=A0ABY3U3C0_9MYCO|nr:heme-binding protein [Mycolicibacillus parakoreensis]MCV7316228.1 heme-binding protein [Mycolicibacillus parakoreensis]ULN52480.1 heme-binding protein [Mycolicibacillus parakoreensis]HLR99277.1 heme-binding protein [Mycolicibacillus parakoreensis]